jgi:hypothetical protein
MHNNLWNTQTPIRRIDYLIKIDVKILNLKYLVT